jgi:hypothetical protein
MAGLGQIAFLGGGGISGLAAAGLTVQMGVWGCFGLLGSLGLALGTWELVNKRTMRLS